MTGRGPASRAVSTASLHREGATRVLADRRGEEQTLPGDLGVNVVACNGDVTHADEVARPIEVCQARFGALHVTVNNAGIASALAPIADCSVGNFERVIAVDLKGVFLGMKYGIPAIAASGGGSVINLSSVAGLVGWSMPAYSGSKVGVIQLSKGAVPDYASVGSA